MITICDTGPIIAYLNRRDPWHDWAVSMMKQLRPPLLICEPVMTEAAYFLCEDRLDVDPLFQMIARGALLFAFDLESHWPRVRTLMARYSRMDLADAAVVVMVERNAGSRVLTTDRRDFSVYRQNDRQVIEFIAPPK